MAADVSAVDVGIEDVVTETCTRIETEVPVLVSHFRAQAHGNIRIGMVVEVAVVAVKNAITVAVYEGMRNNVPVLVVNLPINVECT